VILAHELKSFDYRLLHELLRLLIATSRSYAPVQGAELELLLTFLTLDEQLTDIADDVLYTLETFYLRPST